MNATWNSLPTSIHSYVTKATLRSINPFQSYVGPASQNIFISPTKMFGVILRCLYIAARVKVNPQKSLNVSN